MPDYYGTATGLRDYCLARDLDIPTEFADDATAIAKLLVASEWIDARFRVMFSGSKTGLRPQLREWPRTGATDYYGYSILQDEIPREIIAATYEAALREQVTPGVLSVDWTPNKYRSVSIDGALSVDYAVYSSATDIQTQFTLINEILAPLLYANDFSSLSGAVSRV